MKKKVKRKTSKKNNKERAELTQLSQEQLIDTTLHCRRVVRSFMELFNAMTPVFVSLVEREKACREKQLDLDLENGISLLKERHKKLDWDAGGRNHLEFQVLQYGVVNGIADFELAFYRYFYSINGGL